MIVTKINIILKYKISFQLCALFFEIQIEALRSPCRCNHPYKLEFNIKQLKKRQSKYLESSPS